MVLLFFTANALAQTAPVIISQPQTQTAVVGNNVTFWVTVSDGSAPPSLPAVSSGALQLWLTADTGVTTNSAGLVSLWQDQSGNGNAAAQSDTNLQPTLVSVADLGGKPAVRFNGIQNNINGSYLFGTGTVNVPDAMIAFTVYNAFAATNAENVLWEIGIPDEFGANRIAMITFGDLHFSFWSYDFSAPFIVPTNTYRIRIDELDTNLDTLNMFDAAANNATNFTLSVDGASTPGPGYYVGGLNSSIGPYVGSSRNLYGDIAEVICYQGSLSETDQLAVLSYLQQKYYLTDVNSNVSYQWQFDNTNILGDTNATLTLTNIQTNAAGSYSVIVTDLKGSTNSANVVLTVNLPPPCAPAPAGLVAWLTGDGNADDSVSTNNGILENGATFAPGEVGQAFSFNGEGQYVQIADSPSLEPQSVTLECWFNASNDFSTANLISKPVGPGTSDSYQILFLEGSLSGVVSNPNTEGPILSYPFTPVPGAWYHTAYTFDSGTQVQTLYLDGAVVARGTANLQIGYDSHPVLIGSEMDYGQLDNPFDGRIDEVSIYNRALTGAEIAAIYNAGILGKCGLPPTILAQPLSQGAAEGANVALSVTAGGTPPLAYQWSFNLTNILGATNAELTLTNLEIAAAGTYAVFVTNALGATNSTNAVLAIGVGPSLSVQPLSQSAGPEGSVTFSVVAAGGAPLNYQWEFDNAAISGATNSSLTVSGIQSANGGTYTVVVTNLYASITSSNALLTVLTSVLQVVNSAANGSTTVLVPVQLLSAGNENSLYFSLDYSNSLLTYTGVTLGSNTTGAFLIDDKSQTNSGHVGLELELPGSAAFSIGTQQVAVLSFAVSGLTNAVVTPVTFGSQPTAEGVFNAQFTALPATYSNGSLSLAASAVAGDVSRAPMGMALSS
jgi:hypothetical protein